jgi:thiol-disulfide isomerase/thioredoxin
MSKQMSKQNRLSGAARRRALARRRRRNRVLGISTSVVVLALVALVIGLHVANGSSASPKGSGAPTLATGTTAPEAVFTTLSGQKETTAELKGKPTLIWFVTTWCSSCQAGTQALARNLDTLSSDGVRVVEIENYHDLGQSGPSMASFARTLAGSYFTNPAWLFGQASNAMTLRYNPQGYLDLYYLLNARGQITYVNSSPGATMSDLLAAAKALD